MEFGWGSNAFAMDVDGSFNSASMDFQRILEGVSSAFAKDVQWMRKDFQLIQNGRPMGLGRMFNGSSTQR